ncbi:MAG: hypothetical protein WKF96_18930 [Solirubrobacteraceae bacterium]
MQSAATSYARHSQGCLFCRGHDGGFVGREHIFSESLGNLTDYVLPPGVVCDRCNNGPLSAADGELIGFEPIAMLRAERGLPTKSGKPIAVKFANATLWFSAPGQLNVESNSAKTTRRMSAAGGELDLLGRPITPRRARLMVRSIWKSTLELIYLDAGPRIAFLEIFDSARSATLDDHSRGWATLDRNTAATASIELEYERAMIAGRHAIPVTLNAFGVRIRTDLLRRDLTEDEFRPPWQHSRWTFPA